MQMNKLQNSRSYPLTQYVLVEQMHQSSNISSTLRVGEIAMLGLGKDKKVYG